MSAGAFLLPRRGRGVRVPRGLAALTVVMVLFFVMALVAAYTNRNLIFEQRVAANSYRAERAAASADAGAEWALTLLNSGRVDMNCQPSMAATDAPARTRFLNRTGDGNYQPVRVANRPLLASCVVRNGRLTCVCPTSAVPTPSPHAVMDWPLNGGGSAFRVSAQQPDGDAQPGVVAYQVLGCGSTGTGAGSCGGSLDRPEVDGQYTVQAFFGLVPALPHPPVAVLTTGQGVAAASAVLRIANPDSATGITVHSGGAVSSAVGSVLAGPAGTTSGTVVDNDGTLAQLVPAAADRFQTADTLFRATFGMEAPVYRLQPAVVRVGCGGATCGTADLEAAVARYPGLTLWFDGDLQLDTAPGAALGSATWPVMAIVTGRLTVASALELTGLLYARDVVWSGAASGAQVRGALVAVNEFVATTTVNLVYDSAALRTIQQYYGSFVRVPGGWSRL